MAWNSVEDMVGFDVEDVDGGTGGVGGVIACLVGVP